MKCQKESGLPLSVSTASARSDHPSPSSSSIRPDFALLSAEKVEGMVNIPGRVKHYMFLGEKVRYFVEDQLGKEWIVDAFDTGMTVHEGDVYITVQQGKAHLIVE